MLYKLTDKDGYTRRGVPNECLWGENVTHEATGPADGPLCTHSWIHAYPEPLLAVLMDPVHGWYGGTALLWEGEGQVGKTDGTKCGCRRFTTVRQVPKPMVTTAQRVRFGILASLGVYSEPSYVAWAEAWLSGKDRTRAAADAAADAAAYAADAAADAAATAAAYAADAAAYAADAAADAAATAAAYAAYAAADAAATAAADGAYAAYAAADAAAYGAYAGPTIDFVALAHRAVEHHD